MYSSQPVACLKQPLTENFQVLDEITGGFIKAKRLPQPAIYRKETAVVKADQVVGGVMSIMYKPCKSAGGREEVPQDNDETPEMD